jgi:hypothetical protein
MEIFANKSRRILVSFILACDTTAHSEDVNVWRKDIHAFMSYRLNTKGGALAIAEYLQIMRGNGMELHGAQSIFGLMTPTELTAFIADLLHMHEIDDGGKKVILENFVGRMEAHADVSHMDYMDTIDVLVDCLY